MSPLGGWEDNMDKTIKDTSIPLKIGEHEKLLQIIMEKTMILK